MTTLKWISILFLALAVPLPGQPPSARGAPAASGRCNAASIVRRYTDALVTHRYSAMWALLSPAARAAWDNNPDVFARYQATKFGQLQGTSSLAVSAGPTHQGQAWITVRLRWRDPADPRNGDGRLLLAGYPLHVARGPRGGTCQVADAGFSAPGTPLVLPDHLAVLTARVPILMYHNISNHGGVPGSLLYGLTVSDSAFAAQLAYLQVYGYHTLTLVRLFEYLYYGRPLPARPVILTFDDGYDNASTDAFPLLRRYGAVGVFSVITGKVGLRHDGVNSYATWSQLAAMHRSGMEIESHTVYHEDLGLVSAGEARNEVRFARQHLRMHLGVPAQFLTYPAGEPFRSGTPAAQARVLTMVAAAGYSGALLDPRVPSSRQDARQPYQLPRIRVDGGEPLASFATGLGQ